MINKGRQKKQILGPKYKKTGFHHSHQIQYQGNRNTHCSAGFEVASRVQHPVRSTGWGWGFYHPRQPRCSRPARRVAAKDQPWDCKAKLLGTVAEPRQFIIFIAPTGVSKGCLSKHTAFFKHTPRTTPQPLSTHEITWESFHGIA